MNGVKSPSNALSVPFRRRDGDLSRRACIANVEISKASNLCAHPHPTLWGLVPLVNIFQSLRQRCPQGQAAASAVCRLLREARSTSQAPKMKQVHGLNSPAENIHRWIEVCVNISKTKSVSSEVSNLIKYSRSSTFTTNWNVYDTGRNQVRYFVRTPHAASDISWSSLRSTHNALSQLLRA